jgi:hypothetical protein
MTRLLTQSLPYRATYLGNEAPVEQLLQDFGDDKDVEAGRRQLGLEIPGAAVAPAQDVAQ